MKILEILRNKKYLAVIAVVAIIVVGFIVYKFVFSNKNQNQNVFVVQKSDIVQEVTVTGQVRKGDKINLAFLNSGRLKSVFVKVGDKVEKGDVLARLDIRDLEIQLEEARAGLALAESKLDKLLAGKTQEEILLAETKVLNAQKSLEESQKTLGKTKILAEQSLQSYYETGLDDIRGAYLKADNAYNDIDPIKRNYFHFYDLVSVRVQDAVKVIGEKRDALNSELSSVNSNSSGSEIEKVFQNSEDNLEAISDALSIIRSSCEDSSYRSLIS